MAAIKDQANSVYRDFQTDGVPASGQNDPDKAEIRNLFGLIEKTIGGVGAGLKFFDTKSELDAYTGEKDFLAYVTDDGVYSFKDGAWQIDTAYASAVATVVQPIVDQASGYVAQVRNTAEVVGAGRRYSPADLFTNGARGGWWEPSDLSTVFQDVAQTVPALIGDPVAVVRDKSGNGKHLVCPGTEAARPLLAVDSVGRFYLQFDGVDDVLRAAVSVDSVFDRVSRIQADSWTAQGNPLAGNAGVLIMRPSSPNVRMFSGVDAGPTLPLTLGQPNVITEHYFQTLSTLTIDNGLPVQGSTGGNAPTSFSTGGSPDLGGFVQMRWYGTVMIDRQLSDADLGRTKFYFARAPLNLPVIVSGDSTVAYNNSDSQPAIASFLPDLSVTSIATPGDTIQQQRDKFTALSASQRQSARAVIVQIGLNNMIVDGESTATTIGLLQGYIDYIRASVSPYCRIYIATMTPAGARWQSGALDAYASPATLAAAQAKWQAVNLAIRGGGDTPIANVDGRISAHTEQLAQPLGFLSPQYDISGDHIHPSYYGRRVNAYAWREVLMQDGLLA